VRGFQSKKPAESLVLSPCCAAGVGCSCSDKEHCSRAHCVPLSTSLRSSEDKLLQQYQRQLKQVLGDGGYELLCKLTLF